MKILKMMLFSLVIWAAAIAQTGDSAGILHVEIEIQADQIKLIEVIKTPGQLKAYHLQKPAGRGALLCKVFSKGNPLLHEIQMDNPLETVYEYGSITGELEKTRVKTETARLFLRIPCQEGQSVLELYKSSGEGENSGAAKINWVKLGSVSLEVQE